MTRSDAIDAAVKAVILNDDLGVFGLGLFFILEAPSMCKLDKKRAKQIDAIRHEFKKFGPTL